MGMDLLNFMDPLLFLGTLIGFEGCILATIFGPDCMWQDESKQYISQNPCSDYLKKAWLKIFDFMVTSAKTQLCNQALPKACKHVDDLITWPHQVYRHRPTGRDTQHINLSLTDASDVHDHENVKCYKEKRFQTAVSPRKT